MNTKKRSVFRILIPILIVLVLLAAGACAWLYFSGVGAEFYLKRGDSALAGGRYKAAIRNYTTARQMTDSSAATVSLATAYEGAGNYTKAEYMLVSAIQENPEQTELYVALSRIYVAQGKFLDADQMLSRAANETVREELQKRRPAPPALTPESGYYSTYISVSAESANKVYLRTDGAYPSRETDLYAEPVELPGGETTICALAVDEAGLVSPAVYAGYTVAGVVEPVTLTDPALDKQVRALLKKEADAQLMTNELWALESLELNSLGDVSQLALFSGLKSLTVSSASATDFSSLSALTQLQTLDLSGCVLSEASLKAIGSLTDLTTLRLSSCALRSVTALSGLTKLQELDLSGNVLSSIAPLADMPELKVLNIDNNEITSIAPLAGCTKLEELSVSGCGLTTLEALSGKTSFRKLSAGENEISDLKPLKGCTALTHLAVPYNNVQDISILLELPKLEEFDGSHNKISAIPTFQKEAPLAVIKLNYNSVSSVKGLADLIALNYVHLDYNKVSDLTPLENCANLMQVDAWENPLSADSIAKLQEHSIIVNYKPKT